MLSVANPNASNASRRIPVDCVICAQRLVNPGVEFLSHLRAGRWGGALQSVNFILLLPSRDEGLPMALLEAMASGLVPVTTTVGSIGEAVGDGVTGIVVQPGSPRQIADALTSLVTDESLRARLGAAARGRAVEFGLERWYQRLGCLWTDLANERPEPRR